jgi:hypothetical protein
LELRTLAWSVGAIAAKLAGLAINELLYADALAGVSADEDRVLRRFVQNVRAQLVRDLDPRLMRDTRVFFKVARLPEFVDTDGQASNT